MPITRPKPRRTEDERLTSGVYLTDGQSLYRVLGVVELSVELENCMVPDSLPQWMPVGEVLEKLRVVRPAGGVEAQA